MTRFGAVHGIGRTIKRRTSFVVVLLSIGIASCSSYHYGYAIDRNEARRAVVEAKDHDLVYVKAAKLDSGEQVRLGLAPDDKVWATARVDEGEEPSWHAVLGRIDIDVERLEGLEFHETRWGPQLLWPSVVVGSVGLALSAAGAIAYRSPMLLVPVAGPFLWARSTSSDCRTGGCYMHDYGEFVGWTLATVVATAQLAGIGGTVVGYLLSRPTHEIEGTGESAASWRQPVFFASPVTGGGVVIQAVGAF